MPSSSGRYCPADFQALWDSSDEQEFMLPALDSSDCHNLILPLQTLNTKHPKPETYTPKRRYPPHIWKGVHLEKRVLEEVITYNQNRISAYNIS